LIARALLRPQDRLVACELEPGAHANLLDALRGDLQGRVVALDGWTALAAYVPPKERRGVVLIDPPFEQRDEFERLATGFAAAYRKWPTGIYVLWYPVKDRSAVNRLWAAVRGVAAKGLGVEIAVASPGTRAGLDCAGVLVVNPPWVLADELARLMPPLAACLGDAGGGRFRLESFDGAAASRG
jgi:23S rRNA (adenine2030-N6)-methyltransferase